MHQTIAAVLPVQQSERITLLDSLRGFAILGILLMNIPFFALPVNVALDPSVYNEYGTVNYYVWYVVEWFFSGTQRALFSMLFGAGIILFISRKENSIPGLKPADYFFRRQLWLMVFSLFDVFILLWFGDILFDYACLGMIMFAFRNLSPRKLLIGAMLCLLFMTLRDNRNLYLRKETIHRGEIAAAIDTTKTKLSFEQRDALEGMNQIKDRVKKENKIKAAEKDTRQNLGSYRQLYERRTAEYLNSLVDYLFLSAWDVLLFMFLGMALFKMGILTGEASTKVYWWLFVGGLGLGLFLSYLYFGRVIHYQGNRYEYVKNIWFDYYQLHRALRSIGLFGLIMLLYKSGVFKWLFSLMRPVGQMAFTNYLLQSLLCGIVFYGIGFGLFNQLPRHQIYYVVGAVWLFEIILSHVWLRFFHYGPFEWAWRSLTYWKRQPFKKNI